MDYDGLENVIAAGIDLESEHFKAAKAKAHRQSREVSRVLLLHELAKPVAAFLKGTPEFEKGFMVNLDNGSSGFHADTVASKLVDRALSDSIKAATDWLKKILATKSATGTVVSAVWGLSTNSTIRLTDDISIVPVTDLPDSSQKELLINRHVPLGNIGMSPHMISPPPKAALVRTIEIDPFLWDLRYGEPKPKDDLASQTMLNNTRSALTLTSNVPLIEAIHWFQFNDPDLQDANFFSGTGSFMQEIVPDRFEEGRLVDGKDAKSVVAVFNKASPALRDRVLISIGRFNQAMLRRSPGDKAVELSISLEALLVDDRGEHTHKVGLRAALLAGGSDSERVSNRAIVTAIYSLRSALMHSGHVPTEIKVKGHGKQSPSDVVKSATNIVRKVIRNILNAGELPNWWSLEVSSDD